MFLSRCCVTWETQWPVLEQVIKEVKVIKGQWGRMEL